MIADYIYFKKHVLRKTLNTLDCKKNSLIVIMEHLNGKQLL